MRKMLGSHGLLWPASAPVGVPMGSWKFTWSWKLLGSGAAASWDAKTGAGF